MIRAYERTLNLILILLLTMVCCEKNINADAMSKDFESYDLTDKVWGPADSFTPQSAAGALNTLCGMRYS